MPHPLNNRYPATLDHLALDLRANLCQEYALWGSDPQPTPQQLTLPWGDMARSRGRKPEKGQLGFFAPDEIPLANEAEDLPLETDAQPEAETSHVSSSHRGVSDRVPANAESGAEREGRTGQPSARAERADAPLSQPPHQEVSRQRTEPKPDPARDGSGRSDEIDLSADSGDGLDPKAVRYTELQKNGLFGIAPERAIMRVDLPHDSLIQHGLDALPHIQAPLSFPQKSKPSEIDAILSAASDTETSTGATEDVEEYKALWHFDGFEVEIGISFKPNDIAGHDHLEIWSIEPERHPLPISETGYRSHFLPHGVVAEYGGPVAATLSWLEEKAQDKEWQKKATKIVAKRRQPSLLSAEPSPSRPTPNIPAQKLSLNDKARKTIDALYLLKYLEAEGRPATDEEKEVLAGFSGFGPLANHIFPEPGTDRYKPGWSGWGDELKNLLTEEEYESAKRSTFNAFYTSPTIMQTIYDGLAQMGVPQTGIHALEPGCGIGNFMGAAPEGMKFTGVEKENLSGRIARLLYPDQDIRIEPFQKTALPKDSVDLVVGNVPFSDLSLKWRDSKLSLHEYFFAKSLESLHEGGVLALVTSRYLMDKKDSTFRESLAKEADFLGAMRLPKGAFRQEGTEVVTDIVFLRKRGPNQAAAHEGEWLTSAAPDGKEAACNGYFLDHPEMVIGELAEHRGMYRNHELTVAFPDDYEARLQNALTHLPANAYSGKNATVSHAESQVTSAAPPTMPERTLPAGSLFIGQDGHIMHVVDEAGSSEQVLRGGKPVHSLSGTVGPRLAGLIEIRDAAREVLHSQREQFSEEDKDAARQRLNQVYDQFVDEWGAINKTKISTTSSGIMVRRQPNLVAFKEDPDAYLVMALEQYDEKSDTATKMPIMERDVIGPTPQVDQVESALDGLLVCLNLRGKVDIDFISQLYDAVPEQVIDELGAHIFYDPSQEGYVTADDYLSGNVRKKLEIAKEAADDPRVAAGIAALEAAQPAPIPPGDIDVALGASWIPPQILQTFIADLLNCQPDQIRVRHLEKDAFWSVDADGVIEHSVDATSTYGTKHRDAITLINDALNMRVPTVTKTITVDGQERNVADQEATLAAREKQKIIKGKFQQWLFADPARADQLTEIYNRLFNTTRLRRYDGDHLTFAGMNPEIELRPHQKDAVWRVMNGDNSLLAHAVGAGKTFEMIAAGTKMKQTGLIRKPLFVVPNHMLEQFSREFYQLYPNANLLVASKDGLKKEKRKLFTAKSASGEWDGIIMTHSSFEKIGMSPDFQAGFVREQIKEYETLLTDMNAGDNRDAKRLIKRIEKQKEQWEARLEELLDQDRKDAGLTFEDLGVDHIFVDEAHMFKNLETPTKMGQVAGVQTTGSLRAFDLFMKTRYLDQEGHGTTFATGTPISNSMVEMYTMSRFLAPELLEERGISHFDGWAAVFGDIVDTVELSPDAKSLRQNRRFAKFVNLPELLQIFHSFADVKTADMLQLPTPDLKNGQAEIIATPMTPHQQRIQESLVQRYERVRSGTVDPRDDNALKITTDGRKLALDPRLVLSHLPDSDGKLDAVADKVYEIWQETSEQKSAQLLFCDLGVSNKNGRFSAYDAIIRKLTERGIPPEEIANIGNFGTDAKKAQLFSRVRNGDVRVLLGSTQKMGTGTNVQERLIALHHVDAPWKPAEVEQREGRILRQGNLNDEVEIYRYVTEGSFDAYMWQTLQTKAEFINQIMKGDMSIRRIEDMDDQTLSYAEVKAIASGNPAVLTLAKMDMEVQRLSQLARAHQNEQYQLRQTLRHIGDVELPMLESRLARQSADIATVEANGGIEQPKLILNGQTTTDPKAAQEQLRTGIETQWERLAFTLDHALTGTQERVTIGTFGGLEIQLTLEKNTRLSGSLSLKGESRTSRNLRGPGSERLLAYLNELVEALPQKEQELAEERDALQTKMEGLQTRLGLSFEHDATLAHLTEMRSELQALLQTDVPALSVTESIEVNEPENEAMPEETGTTPSPESIQERVNILVNRFDAIINKKAASIEVDHRLELKNQRPQPVATESQRAWTKAIDTPESASNLTSVYP